MSVAPSLPIHMNANDEAPTVPGDWPLAEHSQFVTSFGTRWHVQRVGTGPVLVLVHGTAASTHSFRDVIPLLAPSFSVIAIDLPGHGFSSRLPDGDMSLPAIARGLRGLFETLAVPPQYLVGHSAGAAIALKLALGSDTKAVVGLNAALLPFGGILKNVFSPLALFFASTRLMPNMLARRAADPRAVSRVIRGTGSVLDTEGLELYQRLFTNEQHIAAVLSMMASWDLTALLRELPALKQRLLLVAGRRDQAVRASEARRVADRLATARVVELEDCGHLAHEEQPDRVAKIIQAFCQDDDV